MHSKQPITMRFFFYTLLLAATQQGALGALLGARHTTGCNANNCARAVTGTRTGKLPDVTSRKADCSSFLETTIGPSTTIVPSQVPTYASACSGAGSYSSACSCWGVTPKIIDLTDCPNPGTCGSFDPVFDPSCGPFGVCVCGFDVDGRSVCMQDVSCSAPVCSTDSDCGPGGICWGQGCCGPNLCTFPATVCANPASIMARRVRKAKREGCTNASCD